MINKKRVIVLTDGDQTAYRALQTACDELNCHPLSASKGNPTPLDGKALLKAIQNAPKDPVVVMVDDRGDSRRGQGEDALSVLIESSEIDVLGVIAVAANTEPVQGVSVQSSVDQDGVVIHQAVNKDGHSVSGNLLKGDTVDVLDAFSGTVVGLGDPGKMEGHDAIHRGVPATLRATQEILERSGAQHDSR